MADSDACIHNTTMSLTNYGNHYSDTKNNDDNNGDNNDGNNDRNEKNGATFNSNDSFPGSNISLSKHPSEAAQTEVDDNTQAQSYRSWLFKLPCPL
eukprot:5777900-Amphidinium_carterae.1